MVHSSEIDVKKPRLKVKATSIGPEEILTTMDLQKFLKINHKRTIYDLIKQGMPVIKAGRNFRFIKQEVLNFLRRRTKMLKLTSPVQIKRSKHA